MTGTSRNVAESINRLGDSAAVQHPQPAPELWQEVRQTSPEMAMQARIIRVQRPSASEQRNSYPTASP